MSPGESHASQGDPPADRPANPARRGFMSSVTSAAMVTGLAGGYGMFGALAGRYLYPAKPAEKRWMFVSEVQGIAVGQSLSYQSPDGHTVAITRLADAGNADDFVALSSICPHLGCQVHWESQNNRFFCPCHNGAFDSRGTATEGPPFDARQNLLRFPLQIERGLLFIEVAITA